MGNVKVKMYKLTNKYESLDDQGKYLVNGIIKFCEENNKFPNEKDMKRKRGYIPRTQYYNYFEETNFKQLYNYILPVYNFSKEIDVTKFIKINNGRTFNAIFIKPNKIRCIKCDEIKEFTEDNFPKGSASKFGLKYMCKDCETKEAYERNLLKFCKKNNIKEQDRYNIYSWYDAFLNNNLKQMPEFCYQDKNIIDIIRYIFKDKLNLHTIEEICSIGSQEFGKYRIDMSIHRLGGKLLAFQKCFPELKVTKEDVFPELYTDENINETILYWINDNKLSVNDLLESGLGEKFSKKMDALWARKFSSLFDIIMWYFKYNNILHPIYCRPIDIWDFESVPHSFWQNKQNRLDKIKHYCELECEDNILDVINDTDKLKLWIYKYFRSELISKIFFYHKYNYSSLYDLLVESYPIIKENNILFDWEWHQCNKSDKPLLLRMLRELVKFRLNEHIKNPIDDIPKYINRPFIETCYPKFIKHIHKKRFKNFYDWCCEAFPEYANYWIPEDFGLCVAVDGAICNSLEERVVYEFIKYRCNIEYIEAIGNKHSGKHVFILPYEHEDNKYCPDFVVEYINDISNKKIKFEIPIYIEYYGLYSETNPLPRIMSYKLKTDRKNEYFKNLDSIIFIDLYPEDLKNNCEGVKNKINNILINLSNK